jgi:CheY-like chemotaxis protein
MQPEISNFRINDLLAQLKLEFAPLAAEKGLELKFLPCSLNVRSDRRLLRRLLQNLVSNGIKYTPKGHVTVGCRRLNGKIRIEIHDTGLGIPFSQQKIIFHEFQRLDQGARAARGLGLGLSIVERIARVLGHKISLRSKSRKGSTFAVEVPTVSAAVATEAVVQALPTPAAALEGIVTLCIDNDQQILDGMSVLLSGWGCHVLTAPDLEGARAILATRAHPDVLLVDYHLDQGNGIDVIATLRQTLGKRFPAALITADRSPQVRDEAREKDIQVLNKPLKPAALRAFLAQWRVTRPAAE